MNNPDPRSTLQAEWLTVLSREECKDSDNFFALGGDSLTAMELVERVESRLGGEFPIDVLFSDGTFGAVLRAIQRTPPSRIDPQN